MVSLPSFLSMAFDFSSIASETVIGARSGHLGRTDSHQTHQTLIFLLSVVWFFFFFFSGHSIVVRIKHIHACCVSIYMVI